MTQEPILEMFDAKMKKNLMYRLCNGLDLRVVLDSLDAAERRKEWYPVWMEVGDKYRELAEKALDQGYKESAGELFVKAGLGYHFAQFLHYGSESEKEHALKLKAENITRAESLVHPPIKSMHVDFEGARIPVQIRTPAGPGPHPTIIIIVGLDSAKEEYLQLQEYMIGRGFAMVGFDGPGQNQVRAQMKMRLDYHKAVSAVADAVSKLPEIDGDRLGLLGQSFGAMLAPMALARDSRFKVAAANGGFYGLDELSGKSPTGRAGIRYIFGVDTEEEAVNRRKGFSQAEFSRDVRAPLMVIHGTDDPVCSPAYAKRMLDESGGPGRFVEFEDGIHMCHNVAHKVRPMVADWFVDHLIRGKKTEGKTSTFVKA